MIATDEPRYLADFEDVIRIFYPDYVRGSRFPDTEIRMEDGEKLRISVRLGELFRRDEYAIARASELVRERQRKRYAKISLYRALSEATGRVFPWGSLTGIRPTGTARMLMSEGETDPENALIRDFDVTPEYARTVSEILVNQQGFYSDGKNDAAVYVHVPVCPSRCYYCSFVSELTSKCKDLAHYADALAEDVRRTLAMLSENGYRLTSVYVGGGTPTVLNPDQLFRILSPFKEFGVESTVEAGRPDTITAEKLDALAACGVTRVSVNPQTFCDRTLARIGRNHTVADAERAYELVRRYPFVVNMDLIEGLDGETPDDASASALAAVRLRPENITLHTLCKKRGSDVHTKNVDYRASEAYAVEMMTRSQRILSAAGYRPYYLYRQKNMLGGLHNVGYTLDGYACRNNIDTMEERVTVAACGSGGICKRLYGDGMRIDRFALVKPIGLYLERFEEMTERKRAFLSAEGNK